MSQSQRYFGCNKVTSQSWKNLLMRAHPEVTIAIPVCGEETHLSECLRSVASQSYPKVQVIIVFNKSRDTAVLEAFARLIVPDFLLIQQEGGNVSQALNLAVKHMTGAFFTWLSPNDILAPNRLSSQMALFGEIGRSDAVIFSNAQLIDESGKIWGNTALKSDDLFKFPLLPLCSGSALNSTYLIPEHTLRAAGNFDRNLRFTFDLDMWNRLLAFSDFHLHPLELVAHRISSDETAERPEALHERNRFWFRLIDSRAPLQRAQCSGSSEKYFSEIARKLAITKLGYAAEYARLRGEEASRQSLVSVVLGATQNADLLGSAQSVLGQTHKKLELLIVGSSDKLSPFKELAKADPRVRLIPVPADFGISQLRNIGLENAEGEYLAFLDAGSHFVPAKLEVQIQTMQRTGSVFSHTSYSIASPRTPGSVEILNAGSFNGVVFPEILSNCPVRASTVVIHCMVVANAFRFEQDHFDQTAWAWIAQRHSLLGCERPLAFLH